MNINGQSFVKCIMAACLCLLSFMPYAHADSLNPHREISRLINEGDYVAAEKYSSEVIQKGSGAFNNGRGEYSRGEFDMFHYYRAPLRLVLGNLSGAIADSDALIKSGWIPSYGYRFRGMAKALSCDVNGSMAEFQQAKIKGEDETGVAHVLYDRAIAKIILGDLSGADADIARLLSKDVSNLHEAWQPRKKSAEQLKSAIAALKTENVSAAKESLNQAISLLKRECTSCDADVLQITLVLNRVTREAASRLTKTEEALLSEAQQQLSKGRRSEAFKRYVRAYNESTSTIGQDKAIQGAARLYRALKPALPEEARRYMVQASSFASEKNYDRALELYDKGLRIAPWWAPAHFASAMLHAKKHQYDQATVSMQHFLKISPNSKEARQAQDYIYLWESRFDKGVICP